MVNNNIKNIFEDFLNAYILFPCCILCKFFIDLTQSCEPNRKILVGFNGIPPLFRKQTERSNINDSKFHFTFILPILVISLAISCLIFVKVVFRE